MFLTVFKKEISIFLGVIALISLFIAGDQIVETNESGYMQVKQAAVSGDMSTHTNPGMYFQNFGEVTTYKISDVYDFGRDPINVRFNDAATAHITGQIKFRLPTKDETLLRIHQDFRNYEYIKNDLILQVVASTLKQTATHFGAEEVYSTRRSAFIERVNDQIRDGLYATTYTEKTVIDPDGNKKIKRDVSIKRDENGNPIITEASAFNRYGIEVVQLVINEIDFDERTDKLIAERKEAEQQEIVAKANARKAKQDAITEEEKGKADVAKARYAALVIKEQEVIEAEKKKEIAQQDALRAIEEKKKLIAIGEGEAQATKLKVAAGLSPLEEATIDKETAIGVAEKLANVKFPEMMVIGGSGNNQSALNPFDAVGLKSFIDISKQMREVN